MNLPDVVPLTVDLLEILIVPTVAGKLKANLTQKDGTQFDWFRSRMLGGRTNHWGRISLRFGERDFKHKSYDGHGDDWPISYEDVKPYYDKVDKLIGVFGTKENI